MLYDILNRFELEKPRSVFQIGASGGQELDMFFQNGIASGVFIEPLDYPFSILSQNCLRFKNFFPFKALATATDGKNVEFFVASNAGQSSSILKPTGHLQKFPTVSFETPINLVGFQADTISKFAQTTTEGVLTDDFDLIYIDVQGAELEVFKGATKLLSQAKYVFTELGYGGGYSRDASLHEVAYFLSMHDYYPIYIEIDPRHGYGDGLFIKIKQN
jgi:FkbM family methyltransferase